MLTSDAGVECDSDAAEGIGSDGGHFTSATGPVFVVSVVARHGIAIVVVDVRAGQRILIRQHQVSDVFHIKNSLQSLIKTTTETRQRESHPITPS